MNITTRFLFILHCVLFHSLMASAVNYYVNDTDLTGDVYTTAIGDNSNAGTSSAAPKATLTDVINTYGPSGTNVLDASSVIFVDAGMYFTTDANLTLNVNGLTITGAGSLLTFFDNNSTSTDANRWANITGTNVTIQGIFLTGYNYGFGGASTLQISSTTGITITDVQVNENSAGGGSSAIVISGGSTVDFVGGGSNCNPMGASVAGGGVNVEGNGNIVSFTNYSITGNAKSLQGGSGLYISGNNTTFVTLTNSVIADNVNTSSSGGAGIYISGANLTISGSCINNNATHSGSGPKYGGGLTLARGATVTISNSSFDGNSVTNSGKGGAISINTSFPGSGSAASVTLNSCSFSNNTANSEGRHIYLRVGSSNPASVSITECSFTATSQDVRQDNSGTVTVQNSGSPVLSGSGITVINTTPPATTPSTACPPSNVPCFSILPVELAHFEAECQNEDRVISWSTLSERDNDYFILERAGFEAEFVQVAQIIGNGNSLETINYEWIDEDAMNETMYYRLTQVDFDGNQTKYGVISSKSCNAPQASALHYLESENSIIAQTTSQSHLHSIELITTLGQTIRTLRPIETSTGYRIHLKQKLPKGSYFVRLLFSDHEEPVKLSVY